MPKRFFFQNFVIITFLFNYIAKPSKLYCGSAKNLFIENVVYVVDLSLCEVPVYRILNKLNKFALALIDI